jgi:hypothetical protein
MANNENSHAKNIANLQRAVEACRSLGAAYRPTRAFIQVPALDAFITDCEAALTATHNAGLAFNSARDARKALYGGLARYATRVQKGIAATEGAAAAAADAHALVLKIKGERATEPRPAAAGDAPDAVRRQVSAAQTSYDSRAAHFRRMSGLCASLGATYAPAENELRTATIAAHANALDSANRLVTSTVTAYSNALIARDRQLYDPQNGLVARMDALRTYLESAFGPGTPERKLLKGLTVRTLRNERLAGV